MSGQQMPPIEVTRFDDHLIKLWVAGYVNVLVVRFADRFVLLDSGFRESAGDVVAELEHLGVSQIEFLVNTHVHRDHTGGNAVVGGESTIIAHENCRLALAEQDEFPEAGLPTATFRDSMQLARGSERIELIAMPGGHTDGDIIVVLPGSGVVYLGDIIVPDAFPFVRLDYGDAVGVAHLVGVLDDLIGRFPDDTLFMSAHGRDYTMQDMTRYRDMVSETIDVVQTAMASGDSVDGMQQRDLLQDWASWNSQIYDWINTDLWIETIHESLSR